MSNRAVQLDKLGRRAEELQTYDAIIDALGPLRRGLPARARGQSRYCKAITIADTDLEAALALRAVIDTCLQAPGVALRTYAAEVQRHRGVRLRKAGRYEEAVACCEALVKACGAGDRQGHRGPVVKARIGLARSYGRVGQGARQVETLELLLALPAGKIDEGFAHRLAARSTSSFCGRRALVKAARALGALFALTMPNPHRSGRAQPERWGMHQSPNCACRARRLDRLLLQRLPVLLCAAAHELRPGRHRDRGRRFWERTRGGEKGGGGGAHALASFRTSAIRSSRDRVSRCFVHDGSASGGRGFTLADASEGIGREEGATAGSCPRC